MATAINRLGENKLNAPTFTAVGTTSTEFYIGKDMYTVLLVKNSDDTAAVNLTVEKADGIADAVYAIPKDSALQAILVNTKESAKDEVIKLKAATASKITVAVCEIVRGKPYESFADHSRL